MNKKSNAITCLALTGHSFASIDPHAYRMFHIAFHHSNLKTDMKNDNNTSCRERQHGSMRRVDNSSNYNKDLAVPDLKPARKAPLTRSHQLPWSEFKSESSEREPSYLQLGCCVPSDVFGNLKLNNLPCFLAQDWLSRRRQIR